MFTATITEEGAKGFDQNCYSYAEIKQFMADRAIPSNHPFYDTMTNIMKYVFELEARLEVLESHAEMLDFLEENPELYPE